MDAARCRTPWRRPGPRTRIGRVSRGNASDCWAARAPSPSSLGKLADRCACPGTTRSKPPSIFGEQCGCGARSPVVSGGDGERRVRCGAEQPAMAAVRRRRRRGARTTDDTSSDHATLSTSSWPSRWRWCFKAAPVSAGLSVAAGRRA
ncbi:hypothetical protein IscW_ISCW023779 [Ixodes scapularis]|uniref:Uncharacterized protein n=1 Tax=Ixodes scapularis TaxID=6945 RepID=B7QJV4_IXOSC|nr:hypothetical protein IscW_ISCW023779 [Ixodes scapularis]|eukprot:XP_002415461.1 hypothetical protein IscW_ISCW023779 [Ixodes scapularis]